MYSTQQKGLQRQGRPTNLVISRAPSDDIADWSHSRHPFTLPASQSAAVSAAPLSLNSQHHSTSSHGGATTPTSAGLNKVLQLFRAVGNGGGAGGGGGGVRAKKNKGMLASKRPRSAETIIVIPPPTEAEKQQVERHLQNTDTSTNVSAPASSAKLNDDKVAKPEVENEVAESKTPCISDSAEPSSSQPSVSGSSGGLPGTRPVCSLQEMVRQKCRRSSASSTRSGMDNCSTASAAACDDEVMVTCTNCLTASNGAADSAAGKDSMNGGNEKPVSSLCV